MSLKPFRELAKDDWMIRDPIRDATFNPGTMSEAMRPMAPLLSSDLIETDKDFHIHADLPGVEDMDISISDGVLTIQADRKVIHEVDNDQVHSMERSFGQVTRKFALPSNADTDKATAAFKNGVLTVSLPKTVPSIAAKKLVIT